MQDLNRLNLDLQIISQSLTDQFVLQDAFAEGDVDQTEGELMTPEEMDPSDGDELDSYKPV